MLRRLQDGMRPSLLPSKGRSLAGGRYHHNHLLQSRRPKLNVPAERETELVNCQLLGQFAKASEHSNGALCARGCGARGVCNSGLYKALPKNQLIARARAAATSQSMPRRRNREAVRLAILNFGFLFENGGWKGSKKFLIKRAPATRLPAVN